MERAKAHGCRRAIPLAVSGAFHTAWMEPAAQELRQRLSSETLGPMECPAVHNVTGGVMQPGEDLRDLLVRQVMSPVRWEACIRTMEQAGVDTVVEIGRAMPCAASSARRPLGSRPLPLKIAPRWNRRWPY